MKSASWSTLLLGTILATGGVGLARAEVAGGLERSAEATNPAKASEPGEGDLSTGSIEQLKRAANSPGLMPLKSSHPASLQEVPPAVEAPKPAPSAESAVPAAPAAAEPAASVKPGAAIEPATDAGKNASAAPAPTATGAEPAPASSAAAPVAATVPAASNAETVAVPAAPAVSAETSAASASTSAPTSSAATPTDAAATAGDAAKAAAEAPKAAADTPKAEVGAAPVVSSAKKASDTIGDTAPERASASAVDPASAPAAAIPAAAPAAVIPASSPPAAASVEPQHEAAKPAVETAKAEPAASEPNKSEPVKAEVASAPASSPVSNAAPAVATLPATGAAEPVASGAEAKTEAKSGVTGTTATATNASPAVPAASTTITPRETDVAAAQAAQVDAYALKKVVEAHAGEAGPADDKRERAAVATFYAERKYAPLFLSGDDLGVRGRAVAERFQAAALDGLEPRDYRLAPLKAATPEGRAEAEYQVAVTALRFARHIRSGRFDPGKISDLVTPNPPKPDVAAVLAQLASAPDAGAVLAAQAPTHDGYKRLKDELARLRGETEVPVVRLPPGPVLKPGAKDARVAMLRERLGVSNTATDALDVFDPSLADAVKTFQRERGLSANGSLNRETVAALNDESRGNGDKIADVIVNMERWRWLPRELGAAHVFVNIPDFHLDVMRDGKSVHHAKVVTGRPENQTPIFSETMKYVVVNPYWHVPYSIVKKEMMGRLQGGRGLGSSFEVEVGNHRVDPGTVDWNTVSAEQVSIRQRPGDGNALGNIKFLFPNKHSVYIHDTSSRSLFAQSYRALSHGCVRVHEPFSFADAVLSQEPDKLGGAQLKKMIGGPERELSLKVQVPVHISYFTVFVDDAGQVQTRRDIYGHDAKMKRILGL